MDDLTRAPNAVSAGTLFEGSNGTPIAPELPRRVAFGAPGIAPTWSSSDKDFVTTALGSSRVWVTIGHGIINEIYWPSTGQPQIRDFSSYLVSAERWIDLKRIRRYHLVTPGPYLPAPSIIHYGDDYQLSLELVPDPLRDVLLIRFHVNGNYRLVVLLAPHLGSTGRGNSAWIEDGVGYARRGNYSLCVTADAALQKLSCGYVGASDGWQDLNRHGVLTYGFTSAAEGTVAIAAETSPLPYLQIMWRCASAGGLLPEQVWDAAAIPQRELYPGRPSGSAMPLLWAHAEFLKLLVARERGRPIELLKSVEQRYQPHQDRSAGACHGAHIWHWRNEAPVMELEVGRALLIEGRVPFSLHFSLDGWRQVQVVSAAAQPFGTWGVQLPADLLAAARELLFTRRYGERWEGIDHRVSLGHSALVHALAPMGAGL